MRLCLGLWIIWIAGCSPTQPASMVVAPPASADALRALNDRDFDRAIALSSEILASHPEDRQAQFVYVQASQAKASKVEGDARWPLFHDSARVARLLRDDHRRLSAAEARIVAQALYNEACTFAQTKQPTKAIAALAEAVDAGLDNLTLLETDADLEPIRNRPEFFVLQSQAGLHGASRLLARNRPIPFDFQLSQGEKNVVSLADFRGKVVIVNFWASWSPPCRREAPFLADLDRKFREKGLEILGLNDQDDSAAVREFLSEFPAPYRLLRSNEDVTRQLPRWDGYPTTLVLDREGRVRLVLEGFGDGDRGLIEEAVVTLLEEK